MKHALAVRHVSFEDLGLLAGLLDEGGYSSTYIDAGVDRLTGHRLGHDDLLVVLGGPIGAYEDDRYPFLADELRLIEECLRRNVPVLGICLGAQLAARALGARVYPGAAKEIGFATVELTAEGDASCLRPLAQAGSPVLHWHGDTFDLPAGACRLASTGTTANQAFSVGDRILGLQFHIEADLQYFERWMIGHANELAAANINVPDLRAAALRQGRGVATSGKEVLRAWLTRMAS